MNTQCRAKDPSSCRVHGTGGKMQFLQELADHHAQQRNVAAYMAVRADMEKLTDEDTPEKSFDGLIAPDTGNLLLERWRDDKGGIRSEAPNDMLLSNLGQFGGCSTEDKDRIKEILRTRGYSDGDLYLAQYFHFKKDDSGWNNAREITQMEVIRASQSIEAAHGVNMDRHDRDIFTEKFFRFGQSRDTLVPKERCAQFAEGYEEYVKNYRPID